MKILLLDLGKKLRGGQRQVYYLARRLHRTPGFDPLVALPGKAPLRALLEEEGIPHIALPSASDLNPLNIFSFFRIVATQQPDIIHTNDAKGATLAALAKGWLGEFKLVHSRRVSYPLKARSRKKYMAGDALVAVSREIQEVLVEGGIPKERTSTIHSGIDVERYTTEKRHGPLLTIGAVGALSSQKGFEVLIDALAILRDEECIPDWQCLIAGDGPLLQQLKDRADQQGISRSILFLGYRDSREVLPEIDILTVPSVDGEGSNGVIKEGWASGTPVISSDLPSNLELVTHEHDGLVFGNRDARELAACIVRLASDPALAGQLAANGSETVARFTDKVMADKYMALYSSLLS
ncbi:glycosyltransferase [Pseudodesulfovibrio cashew]|uniref:Glycosyltransferase n=1 Tax=Pseudodesulfovibrio cashew TaxID=2678688 RepID=A0A6I6JUE5_9BACT|nr:glycosyltransferase family 4 protein [Pseudodesulfovibrio cashew]QGY41324.1 glycosyltransferase [Pseudodesulfovibrio cashew]